MYWIALLPSHEDERTAWGWRALQFTPRVAQVDEALLVEASASLRLWGGRKGLLRRLLQETQPLAPVQWAQARTALSALGLLRLQLRGESPPAHLPQDLPLHVLTEAREHVPTLERIGCRSWGDLRALPRAGVARRFGAPLLDALDVAYGERPERYPWLQLPEEFDLKVELAALATTAPELMWAAQRLLTQLQVWLQARHRGVLALELEWTLDLRRLNGVRLPPHEQLTVRTAQPTQDIAHLRRLVAEHLSRATLSAPANHLRLRSLETTPWGGASKSLLPEDNVKGERLHQLVERLSVRLGEGNVVVPQAQADHRPERMQRWAPAREGAPRQGKDPLPCDAIYPPWLLPQPLRLEVRGEKPHYHGPLRLLAGPQRLETGWWDDGVQGPALRDYFIARSDEAGLLWVYRERLQPNAVRWYLQGIYA
ncbi:DNA polymerase Y subunit UmuC family protein [Caenimonas soli]|uniref:DNA polymerase Y family protein n=1 Tax=Caenimonas soli TaxID=2735555 RepID=UPI001552B40B|nr:DNA polymerase Y family protein [Caenimonas soli]NPC56758.1 DNA polymerase Y family protein [Caenimonas soli]